MRHEYPVNVAWQESRKGMMCSPDVNHQPDQCISVATPPEFPKGIPGIWSPEHLFTAAVSSCLMTTFLAVAENSGLEFKNFTCSARGVLDQIEGKNLMTEVILKATVFISSEEHRSKAERILRKAEGACLITNSIRSTVTLEPEIVVQN